MKMGCIVFFHIILQIERMSYSIFQICNDKFKNKLRHSLKTDTIMGQELIHSIQSARILLT